MRTPQKSMRCLLGLHTALWCMLLLRNRAQGLLTASQYISIVIRFASLSTLKRPLPVVKPLSLMENDQLLALGKLYEFQVASRPSKTIKSPYVADLVSCAEPGVTKLAHSPSLDCAGMIVEGSTVLCSRNDATKGSKTEYAIQLCYDKRDESSAIVG